MKKILMVCLGNICRSPMAEGIFRHQAAEDNLNVMVDSAGTSNENSDNHPDPRAISCLKQKGIDISNLRARQFKVEDFDKFDLIFVMDRSNYRNVIKLAQNTNQSEKVKVLIDEFPYNGYAEVPDPYYGSTKGFEEVSEILHSTCRMLVDRLKAE